MRGRLILVGVLAAALSGCGGSSASPSASASAGASSSPSSEASSAPGASSSADAASPSASASESGSTSVAACDSISLRKAASSTSTRLKTIPSGTSVHVVATVPGTAYTAGACGTSGSDWLKIDSVGGKTAKSLYGVAYVYAAAGFFQ